MKKYKYLLFDADNTLFDFDAAEKSALEATLGKTPLAFSEEISALYHEINDREWKRLEKGETTREKLRVERFEKLFSACGYNGSEYGESTADIYVVKLSEQHIILPGSLEVVRSLSHDYGIYIITNGITSVQKARLAASPLSQYVKKCFISQEMGTAKPRVDYFEKVLSALNAQRSECLVIGDSLTSDIAGADAAGIDSCWLCPDDNGHNGGRATYIIKRLDGLFDILGGN